MGAVISLEGVHKTYRLGENRVPALQGINMELETGEMVALLGPSGSGKSTLLNICGLLDEADAGEISLLGRPVAKMSERLRTHFRRLSLGFIFQSFNLVPVMSAYENVEYPLLLNNVSRSERQQRVRQILSKVGLEGVGQHLPDKLSGGQRQRVAVARALVKSPSLVIADEPTASLDTETATHIIEMMKGLVKETGSSFLIATHDDRMARHCQRSISLMDGSLL